MAEKANNGTGTVKSANNYHPYYFTLFQNYCCGPRSRSTAVPNNKDLIPIPDSFKKEATEIVRKVNERLLKNIRAFHGCTMSIPDEFSKQDSPNEYLRYLTDRIMDKTLIEAKVICWFTQGGNWYPIRTSGNGNCLLHAVLITMIGTHDFDLIFRDNLIQFMRDNQHVLKKFWKSERIRTDAIYGIQTEDKTLEAEWQEVCDQVRHECDEDGEVATSLEYLEAIHIFCVSNMLARPIIVLSEDVVRNKHGEAISFNDLYGVYLPVLVDHDRCCKDPIVLAYDQSHFCPLLLDNSTSTGTKNVAYLPLYQSSNCALHKQMLPIKFIRQDTDENGMIDILKQYMSVGTLPYQPSKTSSVINIYYAEVKREKLSDNWNMLLLYAKYLKNFFEKQKPMIRQELEGNEGYRSSTTIQNILPKTQTVYSTVENSSTPPPPTYAAAVSGTNHKVTVSIPIERSSSYERAVKNGLSKNVEIQPTIHNISTDERTQPVNLTETNTKTNETKKPVIKNQETLNSNDLMRDELKIIKNETTTRSSDSKLKQDVHVEHQPTDFVHNQNRFGPNTYDLIDLDQKHDSLTKCLVCKNDFYDTKSEKICPDCYKEKIYSRQSTPYENNVPFSMNSSRPEVRFTRKSDFIYPRSPVPSNMNRSSVVQQIICWKCRTINKIMAKNLKYINCSSCGTSISEPY